MSAVHFIVGGACNNGCRGCLWTRRLELLTPVSIPPPEDIQGRGVRLAGREPSMRQDLPDIVRDLRAAGASSVEIETNGRALGVPSHLKALRDAGVTRMAIKLFADNEAVWDAHTRNKGSYAQTLRGIDTVRKAAPRIQLVAVLVPRREPGAKLPDLIAFARRLGFEQARVELRLGKLDLGALPEVAAQVRELRAHPPAGMRVDIATV